MNIKELLKISEKPELYQKGTSIMWTDPHISKQLLNMHINPDIDMASRSQEKIQNISNWILNQTYKPNMKILDLGCGPGLYAELLAKEGHSLTGIDFSENSIEYAKQQASEKKLEITYLTGDYLNLDYENEFDLILLIYTDFCALIPDERDKVLHNIQRALKMGGIFICDVVNDKNIEKKTITQSWEISESGFWKNKPYLALANGYHFPEEKTLANQHIVIDETDSIDTYIFWTNYYTKQDLIPILNKQGFSEIEMFDNILPPGDCWNGDNVDFYIVKK